jgi:hypothetical protein
MIHGSSTKWGTNGRTSNISCSGDNNCNGGIIRNTWGQGPVEWNGISTKRIVQETSNPMNEDETEEDSEKEQSPHSRDSVPRDLLQLAALLGLKDLAQEQGLREPSEDTVIHLPPQAMLAGIRAKTEPEADTSDCQLYSLIQEDVSPTSSPIPLATNREIPRSMLPVVS